MLLHVMFLFSASE